MSTPLSSAIFDALGDSSTVADGDTWYSSGERVRLKGVDAPETGEAGSGIATAALSDAIRRGLSSEVVDQDRYGRPVAKATVDGEDYSTTAARSGLARPTLFSSQEQVDAEMNPLLVKASPVLAALGDTKEVEYINAVEADKARRPYDAEPARLGGAGRDNRGTYTRSVTRGADNLQAMLYGFANAVGELTGIDPIAKWGEEGVRRNLNEALRNPAEIGDSDNIESLADFGTYVLEALGENTPNMLATIGGGGVGALTARAMVGKAALERVGAGAVTHRGALAGAGSVSYPMGVGEVQNELKEAGIDAPGSALLAGIPIAALDVAGLDAVLGHAFKDIGVKTGVDLMKQIAKGFGLGAAAEAPTEAMQELITLTTRAIHDPEFDVFSEENVKRLREAGLKGAIVGGVMGGASRGAHGAMDLAFGGDSEQVGGTAPESTETLQAGVDAVGRGGRMAAFSETGFEGVNLPEDFVVVDADGGGQYAVPAIDANKVQKLDAQGKRDEILGYPAPKPESPDGTVVQAKDEQGRTVQDVLVNQGTAEYEEALRQAREAAGVNGAINVTTADRALAERAAINEGAPAGQADLDGALRRPNYSLDPNERKVTPAERAEAAFGRRETSGLAYRRVPDDTDPVTRKQQAVAVEPHRGELARDTDYMVRENGYLPYRPDKRVREEVDDEADALFAAKYPEVSDPNSPLMRGFGMAKEITKDLAKRFGVTAPELGIISDGSADGIASPFTGHFMALRAGVLKNIAAAEKTNKLESDRVKLASALEVLFHEFGHTLQYSILQGARRSEVYELIQAHERWLQSAATETPMRAKLSSAPLAHKFETLLGGQQDPVDAEGYADRGAAYHLSFNEWWANEAAKYIANKWDQNSVDAPKLVQKLATWLRRMYARLVQTLGAKGLPNPTVEQFLDNYLARLRDAGSKRISDYDFANSATANPINQSLSSDVFADQDERDATAESLADKLDSTVRTETLETKFKEPQTARFFKRVFAGAALKRDESGFTASEETAAQPELRGNPDLDNPQVRRALAKALDDGRSDPRHQMLFDDVGGESNPKTGKPYQIRVNTPALIPLGKVLQGYRDGANPVQEARDAFLTALGFLYEHGLTPRTQMGRKLGLPLSTVVYITSSKRPLTWGQLMSVSDRIAKLGVTYDRESGWEGNKAKAAEAKATLEQYGLDANDVFFDSREIDQEQGQTGDYDPSLAGAETDAEQAARSAQDRAPGRLRHREMETRMGKQLLSLSLSPIDYATNTAERVRNSQLYNSRRAQILLEHGRQTGKVLNVIYERGLKSADAYLRSFDNPTITRIANHFHHRPGEKKQGATMYEAVRRKAAPFHMRLEEVVSSFAHTGRWVFKRIDPNSTRYRAFMDGMVREDGSVEATDEGKKIRTIFNDLLDMLQEAGVHVKRRNFYFPMVFDLSKWNTNRDAILEVMRANGMDDAKAIEMYERIANSNGIMLDALDAEDSVLGPSFRFAQERTMTEELRNALREYRVDDLQTLVSYYIDAAVRRVEVNNRWAFTEAERTDRSTMNTARVYLSADEINQPTAKLKMQLRRELRDGRITQQQYNYITGHVLEGYFGRLGASTDLRWKQLSSAAIVYQNFRLLSLATLSSLVDAGTLLWRGGSLTAATKAMGAVLSKSSREDLMHQARMLGSVRLEMTDHVLNDPVTSQFLGPSFKLWNEAFFRAIGMHTWTNTMRVMGLHMAKDYLKRSVDNERALSELGVTAAEIKAWDPASSPETWPPAVASAVNTFIDEAVMRPEAPTRPTWGNDQRLAIFFHLKSFMWTFHEMILRRVASETRNKTGLYKALPAITMVAFTLPFAMLGYELRRKIAWWGEEPPGQELEGWDYMWEMAQRSGYLGIMQVVADAEQAEEYGKISLLSVAGPTVDQISEFFQKDFDYFLLRSIPVVAQSGAARAWIREEVF